MFAKPDKHFPSMSGQTSIATAVTNFTKSVTKINFGPGIWLVRLQQKQEVASNLTWEALFRGALYRLTEVFS